MTAREDTFRGSRFLLEIDGIIIAGFSEVTIPDSSADPARANDMVDEGILEYEEKTGMGGYHRVYYPKMDREEFSIYVIELIKKS